MKSAVNSRGSIYSETEGSICLKYPNRVIKLDSNSIRGYSLEGYRYRGMIFQDEKKYELAINDFKKALKLYPIAEKGEIPSYIGDCYYQLKNYKEAILWYTVFIDKNDMSPEATEGGYRNRAEAKYLLGDKKGACEDAKKSDLIEEVGDPCEKLKNTIKK